MTDIEKNDYKTSLTSSAKDEIGHLIRTFSRMVARINYLINEVYKNEIAAQKYELKILQAQIRWRNTFLTHSSTCIFFS